MSRKRRKRSKKWIGKVFFLILLIMAVVICYLVWDGYFNKDKDGERIKKEDDKTVVTPKEDSDKKEEEKKDESIEKEEVIQYDGNNPNENEVLTGVITYAGVSGNDLIIRVNIDQYLSGGSCVLNLIRDGGVIFEDTARIIDSAATSTCEGFNVPLSGLGGGKIQVKVKISSGDKTGTISGEAEI